MTDRRLEENAITARANNAAWLNDAYREHFNPLCRYLNAKYGAGPPEPKDIAQEAFARIAELEQPAFDAIENKRAFLFRIAENLLISTRRRARTAAAYVQHVLFTGPATSDLTPENVLAAKERLEIIEATLRAMPDTRRRCFIMHRFDGLNFTEIARRSGMSDNGVKWHMEKAMRDISEALRAAEIKGRRREP